MKLRAPFLPLYLLLVSFLTLLLVSCSKEQSGNGTDEQQQAEASKVSSESDVEAEIIFNGLFDDAMGVNAEVGLGGVGIFGRVLSCPDVTVIRLNGTAPFPVKIIMDFGVNGCVGRDGIHRRGKIIITYTNRLIHPGAMATTQFENFYFDNIKVEGIYRIKNTSSIIPSVPLTRSFEAKIEDAKLTKPNGDFTEWNSTKTITQFEGVGTPFIHQDDIFRITGHANGKVKRGNLLVLWSSEITEPLIKKFTCRWLVKGKIRTVRTSTSTTSPWVAELDFGDGTCDNHAVITINGVRHQITLR